MISGLRRWTVSKTAGLIVAKVCVSQCCGVRMDIWLYYVSLMMWKNPTILQDMRTKCPEQRNMLKHYLFLWPPYGIGQAILFLPSDFYLSSSSSIFFSSPNLSGRRLDVYHTSTHGVALVRI